MFDEAAERAKLEVLDLTEDVIDMIIKKKRATYESKNAVVMQSMSVGLIPIVEPIKESEEPTYYPCYPPIVEPLPLPREIPIPVLPEPTMERTLEPIVIVKRALPWQRRK